MFGVSSALASTGARSAATFAFPGAARRLDGFSAPTVWHGVVAHLARLVDWLISCVSPEFSPLAQQFGAVNLGQGRHTS